MYLNKQVSYQKKTIFCKAKCINEMQESAGLKRGDNQSLYKGKIVEPEDKIPIRTDWEASRAAAIRPRLPKTGKAIASELSDPYVYPLLIL